MVGGGQLGRMTALSARAMGYRVVALDPSPECAIAPLVDRLIVGDLQNSEAIAALSRECQVITLEIEKVSLEGLRLAATHCSVHPSAEVIGRIQDKGVQKDWLRQAGFPVGPYRRTRTLPDLYRAIDDLGGDCFVKAPRGGYDGRGQVRVQGRSEAIAAEAWTALGGEDCLVEAAVNLERELSVLVARSPTGETVVYEPSFNHHTRQVLDWSMWPGPFEAPVARCAQEVARGIAEQLKVIGLLAVELFLSRRGELWVNELAPRPHNSFHATEAGCVTSQFEQLVRAVTDLPLGSVEVARPAAVANLVGDLWKGDRAPDFSLALRVPETRLHLYGKGEARPGRKMGHLSATATTSEEALERVCMARAQLGPPALEEEP